MIKIPQILRYPGAKNKFLPALVPWARNAVSHVATNGRVEFIEPFFGSGAGLALLATLPSSTDVVINDLDQGIYSLWVAVREQPDELKKRVRDMRPSVELFEELREHEQRGQYAGDVVTDAVRKIALHRTSVSGYGSLSGGPLGGRDQKNPSNRIDCRWNATSICQAITRAHRIFWRFGERLRITMKSAVDLVKSASRATVVYLDPPYVQMGAKLYNTNMTLEQHTELNQALRSTESDWLLSYDESPWVFEHYEWASIRRVSLAYSNRVEKSARKQCTELLIEPAASRH